MDVKNIEIVEKLGNGAFADVYSVKLKDESDDKIYAAKYYNNSTDEKLISTSLHREIKILSEINHPAVVKFYGFSPKNERNEPKPIILTEYISNGSLDTLIEESMSGKSRDEFDDTQKLIILYGIASGMAYLHSINIIHRDLKPANVLLDSDYNPKICDFGISKNSINDSINSTGGGLKGTPLYAAPEVFEDCEYSEKGDVYSFAILTYQIITNTFPFPGLKNTFKIANFVTAGRRPNIDDSVDDAYRQLIEKCWSQEPFERPTFEEIQAELENIPKSLTHDNINKERFEDYVNMIKEQVNTAEKEPKIRLLKPDSKPIFESKIDDINVSKLKRPTLFNFLHDDYQIRSINRIEQNETVFVTSPPSTGKTTIAYYAINNAVSKNKRIIYTSPIKSLLHPIYEDFCSTKKFNFDIGYQDGEKTNDINTDAPVLVTTIENLQEKLNNEDYSFENVETIIIDDFHCIKSMKIFGELISSIPKEVQIIILSEPLSNTKSASDIISNIIKRNVYVEMNEKIAMTIKHEIYHSGWLYALADSSKKDPKNDNLIFYDAEYDKAKRITARISINQPKYWTFFLGKLKQLKYLPALIYSSDVENCEELAQFCYSGENACLLDDYERNRFESIYKNGIRELPKEVFESQQCAMLIKLFKQGIGIFHEDIFPKLRELIERYYKMGYLKTIFCVSSEKVFFLHLAKTVCFAQLYNERSGTFKVKASEYAKISSRAGRRKENDKFGFSIICMDKNILSHNTLFNTLSNSHKLLKKEINIDELKDVYSNLCNEVDETIPTDKKELAIYYKKLADKGNIEAMYKYANIVMTGDGIPVNKIEASEYYKKGADKGHIESIVKYATMLKTGDGIKANKKEASIYYKKAADAGNSDAMNSYALMLDNGDGIGTNKSEAIKYYKLAIEKGNPNSMNNYAISLRDGDGIPADKKEAIRHFKMAVDKGHLNATYNLASMLEKGDGVPSNKIEAIRYFRTGADKGHTNSMVKYATMLKRGDGVEVNKKEASLYYKKAADAGNSEAMNCYALMLDNGDGIGTNKSEAIKYYKLAIRKGNSSSMNNYALLLKNGDGIPADKKEAIRYFKMAIDKGNSTSMNILASMFEKGDGIPIDKKEAAKLYKMSADKGNINAMYNYAQMLLNGNGIPVDKAEAAKYFKKGISKGSSRSMNSYAIMLETGNGVPIDKKEAAKLYKMSADKGNASAMYNYAHLIESDDVIPVNKSEISRYYKMAADKGSVSAMFKYATMVKKGDGIPIDKKEAARYFKMAADKGNSNSMYNYAQMLENGNGIPVNKEEAIRYYKMAADKGDSDSKKRYDKLMKEIE